MAKGARPPTAKREDVPVAAPQRAEEEQEEEEAGLVSLGRRLLEQGELVRALKAFTRAADSRPTDEEAWKGKLQTMRAMNRPRGALKASKAALSCLPGSRWLADAQAELVRELGQEEAAELLADSPSDQASAPAACTQEEEHDTESTSGAFESASDGGSEASPPAAWMRPSREWRGGQVSNAEEEAAGGCPASRSAVQVQREATLLRLARSTVLEPDAVTMATDASAAYRQARKAEMVALYREFYGRTAASAKSKALDTSQYSKSEKLGLSIKDGHRPMPRPEHVELPPDHKQPVGTLSPEELARYSSASGRMLLCVHGDLFDISDRPDKYGPDGPYRSMPGHDITWALWSGYDEEEEWDKYYDLHRATPKEVRDRRFQGLMSWWAFFEQEYGAPVGRLAAYDREWTLPPPPQVKELCSIM